jgi:hypothetical protein
MTVQGMISPDMILHIIDETLEGLHGLTRAEAIKVLLASVTIVTLHPDDCVVFSRSAVEAEVADMLEELARIEGAS